MVLAVALVAVVGDVGGEIRVIAVGFDDDAVLVVAVFRRCEPCGAVLFVDVAACAQVGDRLLDLAVFVQAVLVEPDVKLDAELLHRMADFVEHHRHGALAELFALRGVAFAERLAFLVGATVDARQIEDVYAVGVRFDNHAARDLVDVGALVAVDGRGFAVGGGDERLGEAVDLLAVVVEIVFAHDFGAVRLKYAGHRITDGRPTRAADVDRAGRVGGNEFEIECFAAQVLVPAEVRAIGEHLIHHGCGGRGVKGDVDEARTCDFHCSDAVGVVHQCLERLGELARFHAGLLGELHGGVGSPIAVRAVFWSHHCELGGFRDLVGGQIACFSARDELLGNTVYQVT